MEVIPAINCAVKELGCVKSKIHTAGYFSKWIHLDVADGRFTFNKTWGDPESWRALGTDFKLEVHLMVEDPEHVVRMWLWAGAKRLIVQAETLTPGSAEKINSLAKEYGAEAMLSFSPETRLESAAEYMDSFSEFQILAVHPGLAAQNFLPLVLEKVKALRAKYPGARIEVDGGINAETGRMAKDAGADTLISASYIFGNATPSEAYDLLRNY